MREPRSAPRVSILNVRSSNSGWNLRRNCSKFVNGRSDMMRARSHSTSRVRNPPAAGCPLMPCRPAHPGGSCRRRCAPLLAMASPRHFRPRSGQAVSAAAGGALCALSSKEHILAELVRLGHEVHHAAIRRELLRAGDDPPEQLRALVRAHAALHARYPQLAVVVNEELHAPPAQLAAPALALRQQSAALLLDVLQRGVTAGRFAIGNPADHCRRDRRHRPAHPVLVYAGGRPRRRGSGATARRPRAAHGGLFTQQKEIVDVCRKRDPPPSEQPNGSPASRLICWRPLQRCLARSGRRAADPAAERAEATLTSRCQATSQVICSQRELSLTALFVPRKVTSEITAGYGTRGRLASGDLLSRLVHRRLADVRRRSGRRLRQVSGDADHQDAARYRLRGARAGCTAYGATFWQTNIPPWSLLWTTSSDHAFLVAILQAIRGGRFARSIPDRLYAPGISSGAL